MFYILCFKVNRFFFENFHLNILTLNIKKKKLTPIKIKCPNCNQNYLEKKKEREKNKSAKKGE